MTIYDIAREAGVSASTVSRVINHKPGIKESTRQRVQELLERYHYTPDISARGLVTQASRFIGILIEDIRVEHHTESAYVLEQAMTARGYTCITFSTGPQPERKAQYIQILEQRRVEGVFLIGSMFGTPEVRQSVAQHMHGIPVVLVNGQLDHQYGIGLVALGNNNHWMRGGTYGWQAADAGCIGICWSNTCPNMPTWGAKDNHLGNTPLILAVPRTNGEHIMVDCAMSQFSYGKLETMRLAGKQLPAAGGYDENGQLTTDPAAIERSGRVIPIGYWKGSGLSILLDMIATILTNANSVAKIGTFGDEVGLTQIMIAIDPAKFQSADLTDAIIDTIAADVASSEPVEPGREVRCPGMGEHRSRRENMELGIPVAEEKWSEVLAM